MGFNPGKNVGRLSIRVNPDTTQFRSELRKKLEIIARNTEMTVQVTKANLDRAKIREDIRRQMAELTDVDVDVNAKVTVDKAKLKKVALRQSIQEQFDRMDDIRVKIAAEIANAEGFQQQVDHLIRKASGKNVKVDVNAQTFAASRQLAFVTRDRIVNVLVRVNKASMASALTTLSALSGARLSLNWLDDLATFAKNLDKNLPSIINWTTGLASVFSGIVGAAGGLVGIGQGLVSMLPGLLVLPGLIANASASVIALFVAWRNAKTELAALSNGMHELGDLINSAYWERARQPIVDLVQGLMPQLRTAFQDVTAGVGDFTAELANAFSGELGAGRLESIFKGIADGWRVLATGAPAFASAMVSLSNIAATYTPRLAHWLVRQANTFDNWLDAISNDGRLGHWMEDAIKSTYDLWDATKGIAGVFEGIWSAAKKAGSSGLSGFADLMLTWERTVKSADFQTGLTAVFRGANTAMAAFGDAVVSIGRLIGGLDASFSNFLGSAGKFAGGLIGSIADALNSPQVKVGLDGFSSGLLKALEGIKPSLQPIADTFGSFLGLLGDLTANLLPTATTVLADLMPSIDAVIASIRDSGVLESLADAVKKVADELGPSLAEFVKAASPILIDAIKALADALVAVTPVLDAFVKSMTWLADGIKGFGSAIDRLKELMGFSTGQDAALQKMTDLLGQKPEWDGATIKVPAKLDLLWEDNRSTVEEKASAIANTFMAEYQKVLSEKGQGAADKLVEGLRKIDGIPPEVLVRINSQLENGIKVEKLDPWDQKAFDGISQRLRDALDKGGADGAKQVWQQLVNPPDGFKPIDPKFRDQIVEQFKQDWGIQLEPQYAAGSKEALLRQTNEIVDAVKGAAKVGGTDMAQLMWNDISKGLPPEVKSQALSDLTNLGIQIEAGAGGAGGGMARGLAQGFTLNYPALSTAFAGTQAVAQNAMAGSELWLAQQGVSILTGLTTGMQSEQPNMTGWISSLSGTVADAAASAGVWLNPAGVSVMTGMAGGMNGNLWQVSSAAGNTRGAAEIGSLYGSGFGSGASIVQGIADGINAYVHLVQIAADAVMSVIQATMPRSPAKRGPFSGSGWTNVYRSGTALGTQFTDGLRSGIDGTVDHAMASARLRGSASSLGSGQSNALRAGISYVHNGDIVTTDPDKAFNRSQELFKRALAAVPMT